jgi:hypothetical protein
VLDVAHSKDAKLLLFGALNLVEAAIVGAIPLAAPSRVGIVNGAIGAAALLMLVAGPALVFGGRMGRRIALGVCLAYWAIGLAFAALIVASAAHMYGMYGRFGTSAGSIAFALAAMALVLFWLIPMHEIHYLARRAEKP